MRRTIRGIAVFVIAAATSAVAARAAEGAVLPCGATVTQSVVLTADVVCSGNDLTGLRVTGAGVTVDLNGRSVRCTCDHQTFGVHVEAPGVRVRNGTVRGFGSNVQVDGAGARLERLRFVGGVKGAVITADDATVLDSSVRDQAIYGIEVGGADRATVAGLSGRLVQPDPNQLQPIGVAIHGSTGSTIRDSRLTVAPWPTLELVGTTDTLVSRVRALRDPEFGAYGFTGDDDLRTTWNANHGFINLNNSVSPRLQGNRQTFGGMSFVLNNVVDVIARGNVAQFGGDVGFCLLRVQGGLLERNIAGSASSQSGGAGGNAGGFDIVDSTDVTLRANQANGNRFDGIHIRNSDVDLAGNVANRNADDGIEHLGTGTLTYNTASHNGDDGFALGSGAIFGPGNRAAGNGDVPGPERLLCSE